jgi:hypothetical protein
MTEEEIERAIQNARNVLAWGNTVADYDTSASISAKQWNRFQGQYLGKVAGAADGLQALRAKIPLDAPAGQTMTVVSSFDYIVRIRNTGVLPDGSTSIVTEAWSFDTPVTKGIQRVKRVTSAINAAPDRTQRPVSRTSGFIPGQDRFAGTWKRIRGMIPMDWIFYNSGRRYRCVNSSL